MIRTILILLALSVPLLTAYEASANDLWLDINVASYHAGSDGYCYQGECDDFNEFNYGLGLSYELDDTFEATGGFFRNSYDKHSHYLGVKAKYDFARGDWALTPGLTVGLVTGYDDTEVEASTLQPMALPSVTVSYKRVRGTVGYIPLNLVSDDAGADVITFQLGVRF